MLLVPRTRRFWGKLKKKKRIGTLIRPDRDCKDGRSVEIEEEESRSLVSESWRTAIIVLAVLRAARGKK